MHEPVIESGIPAKTRGLVSQFGVKISASDALRKLQGGQSFVVDKVRDRRIVAGFAYRLNIPIQTAKDGERYRIWRTE